MRERDDDIDRSGRRHGRAALLTPAEMATADRLTIEAGTSGLALMERAGAAVLAAIREAYPGASRLALFAGPGNNGGDAYVVARLAAEAGLSATIFAASFPTRTGGDAAIMATRFTGKVQPFGLFDPERADVVVDGLYGAGLTRALSGSDAEAVAAIETSGLPVVAIDLPSGISGDSGAALGAAVRADLTVTFFREKPGHRLLPGRSHCGRTLVADIGISPAVLERIAPATFANGADLWGACFPRPAPDGHKFDRGHAVVFSGSATKTGAARLCASAALRTGAGLVTMASPGSALLVNAAHLTAVMLRRCDGDTDLSAMLEDKRLGTFALGPGFGIGNKARDFTTAILAAGRSLVLDADAISSFADGPDALFQAITAGTGAVVATPHAGEFQRLFPDLAADATLSKLDRARAAARRSGAVIVSKGADTVIAAPDGRAAINGSGTPWLATAGSGDVLAGIVAGLLAQRMPAFEAACAAAWIHGRAGEAFGPGLIAEDLPGLVPHVLGDLFRVLS